MNKLMLLLFLFLFLTGCANLPHSVQRTNQLSLGMTKVEVIKALGAPDSVKAQNNTEILEYYLILDSFRGTTQQYWVTLANGKVISYGNAGDFGTAQKADITVENRWR